MGKQGWRWLVMFCCGLLLPTTAGAGTLTVAADSSFALPLKELATRFEREQGIRVAMVVEAGNALAARIAKRGGYDLFLAADVAGPARLRKSGLCEEPFPYATGELVLWISQDLEPATDWQAALRVHGRERLAIANPSNASCGLAAREALVKAGLWEGVANRVVYAQNAGQAFQFAYQGSAGLALVPLSYALSEKGREGVHYAVPEAAPLAQHGCVVRRSKKKGLAERFRQFLAGEAGRAVLERYGYGL